LLCRAIALDAVPIRGPDFLRDVSQIAGAGESFPCRGA
jgi:hypothetical protein